MATKNMAKTLKRLWKELEDFSDLYNMQLVAINIEEEVIAIKFHTSLATVYLQFFHELWEKLVELGLTEDVQVNFLKSGPYREIEVLITHGK